MDDKTIRRYAQKCRWYIIGTQPYGKAHVVADDRFGNTYAGGTLCKVAADTHNPVRWRDLCGNCRRIAKKRIREELDLFDPDNGKISP